MDGKRRTGRSMVVRLSALAVSFAMVMLFATTAWAAGYADGTEGTDSYGDATADVMGTDSYGDAAADFMGTDSYGDETLEADEIVSPQADAVNIAGAGSGLDQWAYVYTGSAITPKPVVKISIGDEQITLTEGTDYTVSYRNAAGEIVASPTECGVYTLVITGTGSDQGGYYGTVKYPPYFFIVKSSDGFLYFIGSDTDSYGAGTYIVGLTADNTSKDITVPATLSGNDVVSVRLDGLNLTKLDVSACGVNLRYFGCYNN